MRTLNERTGCPVSVEKARSCKLRDATITRLPSLLSASAVTGSESCIPKGGHRERRRDVMEGRLGALAGTLPRLYTYPWQCLCNCTSFNVHQLQENKDGGPNQSHAMNLI